MDFRSGLGEALGIIGGSLSDDVYTQRNKDRQFVADLMLKQQEQAQAQQLRDLQIQKYQQDISGQQELQDQNRIAGLGLGALQDTPKENQNDVLMQTQAQTPMSSVVPDYIKTQSALNPKEPATSEEGKWLSERAKFPQGSEEYKFYTERLKKAGALPQTKINIYSTETDPATLRPEAEAIYEGRAAPMTGRAQTTVRGAALMKEVNKIAEERGTPYDGTKFATSQRAANTFAAGVEGRTVRAFNVALNHMDTLEPLITALDNNDLKLANAISNEVARQFGKSSITKFEAVRDVVANEVVKSIVGGQNAVTDRQEARERIRGANSPAQLREVLNGYRSLMMGQLDGLRQQYESNVGRQDFNDRFLTGASKHLISNVKPEDIKDIKDDPLGLR